ncbi:cache domain-containing sensor histidine kinase [Paenibacillus sinopodophylli]|uniref:cache domain-containing sensor histidine kinase n=1 Tax=Paenibacillus sinopodophylli TaxID=1837342 RepID=UPI001485F2B8|nr:sensor histidine kinase [Paenibacillus sinopodophylli]
MPWNTIRPAILNRYLFTISIRNRILLYFSILILLPISVISITIYNKSSEIITEKINASVEEKLHIIAANIIQKFETISNISSEIYLNRDVIDILSSQHPADPTEIISEMSMLDKLLSNYSVTNNAQDLFLPRIYMFNRPEYLLYSFTDKVSDLTVIEKEDWYKRLPSNAEYTLVGTDEISVYSTRMNSIKVARRLYGLDNMSIQFSGVLTVDIGKDYFNSILSNSKPTSGSSTFIIDGNRNIILNSHQADMQAVFESGNAPFGTWSEAKVNPDFLVTSEKMEQFNWTIVTLTPFSELNRELVSFRRVIYTVMIICGIVALLMALLLSDNISYPIRKLVNSMKVVQRGNFDISLKYKRNDEFAYLFHSYTKMIHEIKELIDKLYISEVTQKEAELKALQAQINPHFLYNTLDSVNWMALELNAPNISTMVTSLSNFFRYSLSKGNTIISIREEKMQVESYLIIQKIRFQEKLDYTIDFSNDILDCLSVKLILQPLVENAILHGINKKRGKGIIAITGIQSDSLIEITIRDNGAGADVEELNSVLTDKKSSTNFAIRNVNDRIKHYFGSEYGLNFSRNEDAGVTVTLRFPAVKTMEGLHVANDYSG